jgi:tryptophan-rich sensory protein
MFFVRFLALVVVALVAYFGSSISRKTFVKEGATKTPESIAYKNQLVPSKYQPPGYVFGIVWAFIYISYAFVWSKYVDPWDLAGNGLFFTNMLLNLFWVWLFFGQTTYTASILFSSRLVIILLFGLTLYQVKYIWQTTKGSIFATVPLIVYASWLVIASFLNFNIRLR